MIKVNNELINFKKFNDGTFRIKYQVDPRIRENKICWLFDEEIECLELWYLVKHIKEHELDSIIDLEVPYLPSARMDRCQHLDEVFTLKYLADLLNNLSFHKIEVFDPHSHVCEALVNHLKIKTPELDLRILSYIHPNCTYAFPDAGSEKRYSTMVNGPRVFGIKHRDWDSQEVTDITIFGDTSLVKDHDIIICDDIISRGSTLYESCKRLKEMGSKNIYAWISHTEDTVLQPHINGKSLLDYDLINKLYTTNSIFRGSHPKIEIIHEF